MFNLLPEQQKKSLNKEYALRKYYVALIFVVVTLLAAAVFILPSYIRSNMDFSAAELKKTQLQAIVGTQNQVSTTALHELKAETNALTISTSTPLSVLIENVASDTPSGVKIQEFEYGQGTSNALVISGIAETRNELLLFSNNLKTDVQFSNVDLPIESLAADKNASFNITLSVK